MAMEAVGPMNRDYTQMSPSKALRVASLKSRFADTILKAQRKTLFDIGYKEDPITKLQPEKKRLLFEGNARIGEKTIAASRAAPRKMETDLNKQRQKEREAARIALDKIERTVFFDDNLEALKEFEKLIGCSL